MRRSGTVGTRVRELYPPPAAMPAVQYQRLPLACPAQLTTGATAPALGSCPLHSTGSRAPEGWVVVSWLGRVLPLHPSDLILCGPFCPQPQTHDSVPAGATITCSKR